MSTVICCLIIYSHGIVLSKESPKYYMIPTCYRCTNKIPRAKSCVLAIQAHGEIIFGISRHIVRHHIHITFEGVLDHFVELFHWSDKDDQADHPAYLVD